MADAFWNVRVGGVSLLGGPLALNLTSIAVTDEAGSSSDAAEITLANPLGAIALPPPGRPMGISLGWRGGVIRTVFEGTVDSASSSYARGGGRTLKITAKGFDVLSAAKEPQRRTWKGATIAAMLEEAGSAAGVLSVTVAPDLGAVVRASEVMDGESFVAFAERLAGEVGATFKLRNDRAVFARAGSGLSPDGRPLPLVVARVGENLHAVDIAPFVGRNRFARVAVRYHDLVAGAWAEVVRETGVEGAPAGSVRRFQAPDRAAAETMADAEVSKVGRDAGAGSVTIAGNVLAMAEGTILLAGVGLGEDGLYRAGTVNHSYARGGGFVTRVALQYPLATLAGA